ncbi:hypothetical protein ACFQO9_20010, partial [Chryseobacterium zhengzhouense]
TDPNNEPCTGNGVLTEPQQPGITDPNGCNTGIPSIPTSPTRITPCERIITENQKAKEYYNKPKFQNRLTEIKGSLPTDTQEKGFSFGVKDGEEAVTNVIIGASDSISLEVKSSALTIYGAGHTHNKGNPDDLSISSFMDVYFFLQAHNGIPEINYNGNPDFKYYYTFTHDGNEYVFTITNPTDFKNFLGLYPPNEYANPKTRMWNEFTEMGKDAELVKRFFIIAKGKSANESAENALAFILTKYNSGIGFSKKDSNGDFKPIFVKELPDPTNPQSKIYEKTNDCNLK